MKEKIKKFLFYDLEKSILQNLTRISFYLIILLSTIQIFFYFIWKEFLETKDFITLLWAIIVFWYWYTTYERNKELEIIDKLSLKDNINEIIIDWKIKRRLNNKLYINDYLFNIIEDEYLWRIFNLIWITWNNPINYQNYFIFKEKTINDNDLNQYFFQILLKIKKQIEEWISLENLFKDLFQDNSAPISEDIETELQKFLKTVDLDIKETLEKKPNYFKI